MQITRGFVTVATGDEKYYRMAANLCASYRKRGGGKYPFALICDRENEYTACFDSVIKVDSFSRTTVDKLLMRLSPYRETIFLDADTLILANIDDLWDIFSEGDDVSAFGCRLPLESQKGWFTYEGSGKYKPRVNYLISMNGGVYYFRKTDLAERVFQSALEVIGEYASIDFKYFSTPQDEPLMAMAMVINGCEPRDVAYPMIILPAHSRKVTVDYRGNVYENRKPSGAKMIHFSAARTKLFLYHYLVAALEPAGASRKNYRRVKLRDLPAEVKFSLRHTAGALLRKLGLGELVQRLKKHL